MKRLIRILFIALMIMGLVSVAVAETTGIESIKFRGIDWGTPATELDAKLGDVKLYSWSDTDSSNSTINFLYDGDDDYYDGAITARAYARSSSLKDLKVAGYAVENLYVYCVYVPGADGLLTKELKDTALVKAYYKMDTKDPDAAYDDLLAKLTGLYGDVYLSTSKSPYISYTYNVWKALDGSMVCLEKRVYPSSGTEIFIKYASGDADVLQEKAYNALVLQETKDAASNTDGL